MSKKRFKIEAEIELAFDSNDDPTSWLKEAIESWLDHGESLISIKAERVQEENKS
jgi:hypothetical protein